MLTMHALVVQDIEKSYGDRQILRGCLFFVGTNERVGIVGANGAGKSTLLKIFGKETPELLLSTPSSLSCYLGSTPTIDRYGWGRSSRNVPLASRPD